MADGGQTKLLDAQLESRVDGTAILQLVGEIDMSSAETLVEQFVSISEHPLENLVLDATHVSFMDSAGLHALIEGKRVIHAQGTRMFLVPSTQVRRVLELMLPEPLFAARVASVEEALSHIQLQASSDRN